MALVTNPIDGYIVFLLMCFVLCGIFGLCASLLRLPMQPAPSRLEGQATVSWISCFKRPGIAAAMVEGLGLQMVMLMLMTAFPLRMKSLFTAKQDIWNISVVMQVHMLGMYVPGFFVGKMIDFWGTFPVMVNGWILLGISILVALLGSDSLWSFYVSQFFVGCGWSLGFISASRLLTLHHSQEEKSTVQGANELVRFIGSAIASMLASYVPYNALLWMSVPVLIVVATSSMLLLHRSSKRQALDVENGTGLTTNPVMLGKELKGVMQQGQAPGLTANPNLQTVEVSKTTP